MEEAKPMTDEIRQAAEAVQALHEKAEQTREKARMLAATLAPPNGSSGQIT